MANFILSYDLNGPRPSHKEMDQHLEKTGGVRARILETVWYVGYQGTEQQLYAHVASILQQEDRLLVVKAENAVLRNLLVGDQPLQQAWQRYR